MNLRIAAAFSLASILAACGGGAVDVSSTNGTSTRAEAVFGQQWLSYGGGALLAHPKIRVVYWGPSGFTAYTQNSIAGYYGQLMASQWLAWLNDEYAINGQTIGAGQVVSSTVIYPWNAPSDVYAVGNELDRQMTLGALPPPDADTIYLVHLPPQYEGAWTTSDGSRGDSWSFVRLGAAVRYGIVPDSTAGTGRIQVNASAILAALYTNPDRGRIDSWVNSWHEDQGVMCNGTGDLLFTNGAGNITVAKLWSNYNHVCAVTPLEVQSYDLSLFNNLSATVYLFNHTASTLTPYLYSAPAGVSVDLGGAMPGNTQRAARVTVANNVHAASGPVVVFGLDPASGSVHAILRFNVSVSGLYLAPQTLWAVRGGAAAATLENSAAFDMSLSWALPSGFSVVGPTVVPRGATQSYTLNVPAAATPGSYPFSTGAYGINVTGWVNVTCPSGQTWCAGNNSCLAPGGVCPPTCGDGQCTGGETCDSCAQDCGTCPSGCPSGKVDCCGDGNCVTTAICRKLICQ